MHDLTSISSFVEISFAVNILTGTYDKFRDILVVALKKKCSARLATIQTLEIEAEATRRTLPVVAADIEILQSKYNIYQRKCCISARVVSLCFGVWCVWVVYWGCLGAWNWVLITPFPAYLLAASILYSHFFWRVHKRVKLHHDFMMIYENPDRKKVRNQILAALKDAEAKQTD